ncbi:ABC transporter substrate-binding protein [Methylobacterium isbiliense]|jgi:peptide/nickel transport system substrate-binding protein|uniref:Glutathione-binding protein GsiB n=1 Tax=Methylobacterium isbiliense TaxID=315478 RepID=A0ABQ4SN81_9HYPH|nr:ABC transporter substrate-binding protein [Methylobacterium isbiliense]MDN3622132.1 ABC transporter substrate-binding protein [Methylobacterium isbiliense]GJE03275.1 Glutathione-binding protein GsiB [Methylobacterium isbiliense]
MLRLAAACLVAGLALTAPLSAQTLRYGLMEDPDALDPTLARTFASRMVFAALCDKLVDIGPDLKPVPQLATAWELSPDEKTLTMTLRPGVRFHDGEPVNAAAAKFSIERHLKLPGSQRRGEIAPIDSVEVVDDLTFRITLKQPFAPLMAQFTDRAGMLVSPKAAERLGDKFATGPVCAGPFRFVERVPQDRIVVERFPDYWNKDQIQIQRIEFRPIPDTTVRLTNLRAGQLDLLERLAPTDAPQVARDAKLKLASTYELGFQSVLFNLGRAGSPVADPRVRAAFELSLDRAAISQVVFNGEFLPGNQWVSPKHPDYVKEYPLPKRDVAKAKALLAEAGQPKPQITLMVYANSEAPQVGQVIQAMTKEAGFDVKLQATDFTTALDLADKGQYEAYLYNWSGRPDPDGNTFSFLSCKAPLNYPRYCNEGADAALQAERGSVDPEKRKAAWKALADKVLSDRPGVYLMHRKLLWAYSPKISGFVPYPDGLVRFTGLKLD